MVNKYKKYCIKWIDSSCKSGWNDVWMPTLDDLECETTGYLVYEDKNVVVIALSIGGDYVSDQMCIPKCAIKQKKQIKDV